MKKFPIIILSAFLLAAACSPEENMTGSQSGNQKPEYRPEPGLNENVDPELFNVINLDYPGLEKVKEHYQAGELWNAAYELLDYYRNRTTVSNPLTDVFMMNPSVSADEQNKADQALKENDYRFAVASFSESTGATGLPVYYSFKGGDGINWDLTVEDLGSENEKEFRIQRHRHQWMLPQAKVYRTSRDEKYFDDWKTVYQSWLDRYLPEYPEGAVESANDAWYGLQPAERAYDQISIFEYFLPSAGFTPEWLSTFLVAFAKTVDCVNANPYADSESNIYTSQRKTLYAAGTLMPEFVNSSAWKTAGLEGFSGVGDTFNDDGVHNELDPSYHIDVLSKCYDVYRIAAANDALSDFPSDYTENLRKAAGFVKDITYPGYAIDNFNDTRSSSWTRNVLMRNFGYYSEMFPDDRELLWMATGGQSGDEPQAHVSVYPVSGYYMFRSTWKSDGLMMVLKNNYNPDNQWHCQPDNGTFTIWNKGRSFSPDAGCYSYDDGGDRKTYSNTDMHNTMTLNKARIADGHMLGEMLKQESGPNYELIVTQNPSYDGLTHRRAVFFVDNSFFVLVDEGFGSAEGTVNLNFKGGNPAGTPTNLDGNANKYVADNLPQTGKENTFDSSKPCGMHTEFDDSNNMLFTTFSEKAPSKAEWTTGYFSNKLGERAGRRRVWTIDVEKTAGENLRFITVIHPFGATGELKANMVNAEFTDQVAADPAGAAVKVTVNDKEYNLSYTL